ncbi:HMG box domain-containing protein [[Candida] zeylanoides]
MFKAVWSPRVRWYARPRAVKEVPTSAELKLKPNEFVALHTQRGWFVVPKMYYVDGWTLGEVEAELGRVSGTSYSEMQRAIDRWVARTPTPEPLKLTKSAMRERESQTVLNYLADLKFDLQSELDAGPPPPPPPSQAAPVEAPPPTAAMPKTTYIHAWNYFLSKNSPYVESQPGATKQQVLSAAWNKLDRNAKESYRQEYTKLLASGRDIKGGKIVPREQKKPLRRRKKATDPEAKPGESVRPGQPEAAEAATEI